MKNLFIALVVLLTALLLSLSPVQAAPIGTITSFKGEVVIQSGTTFIPVKQIGQTVNSGDRIQTREAEVELTFNDGAVLKVRPFSNASVDERNEESGFWVFKTKKPVRRLNVFIGKMRFKSGSSPRENILQTPTSVCALRGSDAEVGYNNIDSMLKMYEGQPFITGEFVRGFFADPSISEASKNEVYLSLQEANEADQQAENPLEKANAQLAALQVQEKAANELMKNADPKVQKQAELAAAVAEASIAAQKTKITVEEIKEEQQRSGKQSDEVLKQAEQAVADAEAAAAEAAQAAEAGDLEGAQKAAKDAQNAAAAAEEIGKKETDETTVVGNQDETTEETTAETTEETTAEESTTVDTTTAEDTTSVVTTTSSSSSSSSSTETTASPSQ